MALFQRVNGDAQGVTNVDISIHGVSAVGKIISNGIGKHPTAFKIVGGASFDAEMGTGGAVETLIRCLQVASSTLLYQVDGVQVSVLVEATGFTDATAEDAVQAMGTVNGYDFSTATVSSVTGFKIA